MWKHKRYLLAVSIILILVTACSCGSKTPSFISYAVQQSEKNSFHENIIYDSDFALVANNQSRALYLKGTTGEIKVVQKDTGAEWFSNPQTRENDKIASTEALSMLNSQIYVTYSDLNGNFSTYYSKTDSIDHEQVIYSQVENGICIDYVLGKKARNYVFPAVITKEKLETLISGLDEYDREEILSSYDLTSIKGDLERSIRESLKNRFPTIENNDLYIFSLVKNTLDEIKNLPEFQAETLEELFIKSGYTYEDMVRDYEENQIALPDMSSPVFRVPVEVKLEGDDLVVSVSHDEIDYDKSKYILTDITLMPYFGAADMDSQGYMFVPDGTGAIIYLNSGKTQYTGYKKVLYGEDDAIARLSNENSDKTQSYLPVFGLNQGSKAFIGIIESSDAAATVTADIAGRENSYNYVHSSFNLTPNSLQGSSGINLGEGYRNFQETHNNTDIRLRYSFLAEGGSYIDMAQKFREYLIKENKIRETSSTDKSSFVLSLLGAVKYNTTYLGLPVRATMPLTTYSQAKEILSELQNMGISNIAFRYEAFANSGLSASAPVGANLISSLGSKSEFLSLSEFADKNKISFYPDINLTEVSEVKAFDGFNENKDAARDISNSVAYRYKYSIDLFEALENGSSVIVSPRKYGEYLSGIMSDYKKLSLSGIGFTNLGAVLTSDYRKGNQLQRTAAAAKVEETLKKAKENGFNVCIDGGNAYSIGSANIIMNLALGSGNSYILDETVPFYPAVLHGLIPYSGSPVNASHDSRDSVLKTIEYGAIPAFRWTFKDNSALKETDYNIYGLDYSLWLEEAEYAYKTVESAIGDCKSSKITGHRKLSANVFETVFENGKIVYVNYNQEDVVVNQKTIKGKDFLVAWKEAE